MTVLFYKMQYYKKMFVHHDIWGRAGHVSFYTKEDEGDQYVWYYMNESQKCI